MVVDERQGDSADCVMAVDGERAARGRDQGDVIWGNVDH